MGWWLCGWVGGVEGVCVGGRVGAMEWGSGWYGGVDATSCRTCKKIQEEERLKKENQEKATRATDGQSVTVYEFTTGSKKKISLLLFFYFFLVGGRDSGSSRAEVHE